MDDFKKYSNRVRYLTEVNLKAAGIQIDDRMYNNVDHVFPIRKGYELGIPEQLIASTDNLQITDYKFNRQKGSKVREIPSVILEYLVDNEIYI